MYNRLHVNMLVSASELSPERFLFLFDLRLLLVNTLRNVLLGSIGIALTRLRSMYRSRCIIFAWNIGIQKRLDLRNDAPCSFSPQDLHKSHSDLLLKIAPAIWPFQWAFDLSILSFSECYGALSKNFPKYWEFPNMLCS